MVEILGDGLNGELETGNYHPADYPLMYLTKGIIHGGNWQWLSDSDFTRFTRVYGIDIES